MALTLRTTKGSKLTWVELDANFSGLADGSNITGTWGSRGITDSATAKVLTLSGSGARSITITNSATNPKIATTAGSLDIGPQILIGTDYTDYLSIYGATGSAWIQCSGASTDVALGLTSKGAAGIGLYTDATAALQVYIARTPSANRYISLTGSNGGNPTIGTNAGSLAITPAVIGSASITAATFLSANQYATVYAGTATPAGGHANCAAYFSSDAIGIQVGSGVPTTTPANGSIYIRTDGGAGTTIYQRRGGAWVATAA